MSSDPKLPQVGTSKQNESRYTYLFKLKVTDKNLFRVVREEETDVGVDVTLEALGPALEHGFPVTGAEVFVQLKTVHPDEQGRVVVEVPVKTMQLLERRAGPAYVVGWIDGTKQFRAANARAKCGELDAERPAWREQESVSFILRDRVGPIWVQRVHGTAVHAGSVLAAVMNGMGEAATEVQMRASVRAVMTSNALITQQVEGDLKALNEAARAHIHARRFAEAAKVLEDALRRIERSGVAYVREWALWSNLGIAYRGLDRLDRALEAFGQAVTRGGDPAVVLMNRGLARMDAGDLEAAQVDLTAARQAGMTDPDIDNAQGVLCLDLNDPDGAVKALTAAVASPQPKPHYYYNLASALRAARRRQDALDVLTRGIERFPKGPQRGYLYYLKGDIEIDGVVESVGGERIQRGDEQIVLSIDHEARSRVFITGARAAARDLCTAIQELEAEARGMELQLAAALTLAGHPRAAALVVKPLEKDPKFAIQARGVRAESLMSRRAYADAAKIWASLHETVPTNPTFASMLGHCNRELGDVERAHAFYRDAASMTNRHRGDVHNYALSCIAIGRIQELRTFLIEWMREEEGSLGRIATYHDYGRMAGDKSWMIDAVERALRLSPDNLQLRAELGTLRMSMARWGDAIDAMARLPVEGMNFHLLLAYSVCLNRDRRWVNAEQVAARAVRGAPDQRAREVASGILVASRLHRRVWVDLGGVLIDGDGPPGNVVALRL